MSNNGNIYIVSSAVATKVQQVSNVVLSGYHTILVVCPNIFTMVKYVQTAHYTSAELSAARILVHIKVLPQDPLKCHSTSPGILSSNAVWYPLC